MTSVIIEERTKNIIGMDIHSKMAQNRIIFINENITEELSSNVIALLMYMDSLSNEEITIIVDSYGGVVYDGFGILDAMRRMKSPIKTMCIGKAMSMAALVLMCGDTRVATKLSTIMLHQPSGGSVGTVSQMEADYKESKRLKNIMYNIVKERTNISNPEELIELDYYIDAEEAKKLKIIDEVI